VVSDSCNGMSNATFHAFMSYVLGDDRKIQGANSGLKAGVSPYVIYK